MGTYVQFSSKFAPSEDFYNIFLRNKAIFNQGIQVNFFCVQFLAQFLEGIQVDRLTFNPVKALESEFSDPPLQWHLSTFQSQFALVSRSRFGSFMASSGSTSSS